MRARSRDAHTNMPRTVSIEMNFPLHICSCSCSCYILEIFFFTASAPFFLPFIRSQPSQIYAYGWDFVLLFLMFMLIYIHKYKVQVCNTEYNNRNIFLFIYMSIYIVYIWKHCPIILSPFYFAWVARKSHFFLHFLFLYVCAKFPFLTRRWFSSILFMITRYI